MLQIIIGAAFGQVPETLYNILHRKTNQILGDAGKEKYMSKQDDAKNKQQFKKKPCWPVCGNCSHFTFDVIKENGWGDRMYSSDKNLRCSLGGFKVDKTDTCKMHAPQDIKEAERTNRQ